MIIVISGQEGRVCVCGGGGGGGGGTGSLSPFFFPWKPRGCCSGGGRGGGGLFWRVKETKRGGEQTTRKTPKKNFSQGGGTLALWESVLEVLEIF